MNQRPVGICMLHKNETDRRRVGGVTGDRNGRPIQEIANGRVAKGHLIGCVGNIQICEVREGWRRDHDDRQSGSVNPTW